MDQAGESKTLIRAWVAPHRVMISNDEVAGFVTQALDRFVGIGSVDISKPIDSVREVRQCVQELGFKGTWELPPTDRLLISTQS
jgi:uncharacterized protein